MKTRKVIIQQILIVNFCMNCVLGIREALNILVYKVPFAIDWYIPLSMLVVSVLAALPTLLFYIKPDLDGVWAVLRTVFHYLLLLVVIMISGWFFRWYHGLVGAAIQFAVYTLIYIIVCLFTKWMFKRDEKEINSALDKIRDSE